MFEDFFSLTHSSFAWQFGRKNFEIPPLHNAQYIGQMRKIYYLQIMQLMFEDFLFSLILHLLDNLEGRTFQIPPLHNTQYLGQMRKI